MSPYEQARQIFAADGVNIIEQTQVVLEMDGWVLATPDCFLLAVPMVRMDRGVMLPMALRKPDTWRIIIRTGDISKAWAFEPYPLPWYAFQKRGKTLRFHPRDRLRTLTLRHVVSH